MPLKILTIDDKNTIRMIVKRAFKAYDCVVLEAENGQEGLQKARKEKPDLILLDVEMPVMNGIEALSHFRQDPELKGIPIIMLTAEADRETVVSILKLGVESYLVKPIKLDELIRRVQDNAPLKLQAENPDEELIRKYFKKQDNADIMIVPDGFGKIHRMQLSAILPGRLENLAENGSHGLVLNLRSVQTANVQLIKLIIAVRSECRRVRLPVCILAKEEMAGQLKEFEETTAIRISGSLDEALFELPGPTSA